MSSMDALLRKIDKTVLLVLDISSSEHSLYVNFLVDDPIIFEKEELPMINISRILSSLQLDKVDGKILNMALERDGTASTIPSSKGN